MPDQNRARPENPYFRVVGNGKISVLWSLMEGSLQGEFDGKPGFDDLTVRQIAEVLDTTPGNIGSYVSRIRKDTGYLVPYVKSRKGGKPDE